jgi:ribonucleoside-diphosphate reductase alpha chain
MSASRIEGYKIIGENDFYQMLYDIFPDKVERMINFGRRNVSWNTVAPTGTVSLLANNCTGGIEPLFAPYYFRRKKINPNEEGVRVDFVDQNGDSWTEYPVLHPYFKEWCENKEESIGIENYSKEALKELFEKSPYYGSTANDIDWVKRVEIQGIIQKYTTHSISSTINLPNNVTEAEVSDIYMQSWKKGLKGITVYRDGSRSGVLITEPKKEINTFGYVDAVKRPKELKAELHTVTIKGEQYEVKEEIHFD